MNKALKKKKLGIALVGLGTYSSDALAPALKETNYCYLAGIVTDEFSKEKEWKDKYNLPAKNIYNYENFDDIVNNEDFDIIYIVLPVSLHKEFTIRAAKAGKHVICEKPMAMNVKECEEMINVCNECGVMLSIGYHLHFEPYNIEMMRLGQQKIYGPVLSIDAQNGFVYNGDANAWRLDEDKAGGGSLMDMGIYTIQASRYVTGEEPIHVTAREEKTRPGFFKEVDETVYFQLEFPGGAIANCVSSYNKDLNHLKVKAKNGWFELTSAYRYKDMAGATSDGPMQFDPNVNQQA
ncbi:MAG: Gfo/Idh/MocA family oxidoreductase, partial [Bacteroidota bacterium]|nr:Gfo/Idh/MocA family oxidoreductase [Bacteroidota bacterium]